MVRTKHRPDYFFHRGDRVFFHRHQDGPTFSRLDPYAPGEQVWLLHSGRRIFVTSEEIRSIAKQVNDQDLPETRPSETYVSGVDQEARDRITYLEQRMDALEALFLQQHDEPPTTPERTETPIPSPDQDRVAPLGHPDEADSRDEELAAERTENERLRAENEELRNRPPVIREVEKIVRVEVAAPAPEPEPTPEPPADGIPESLRGLMVPDEPAEKFTERMRRRYRYLKHIQMDSTKPTNARAFLDIEEHEVKELADLEAKGAETVKWLDVQV